MRWGPIVAAQLAGDAPARLDSYTTVVTTAIDAAVITPAAFVAGILILRRSAAGYLMAFPLVVLEAMLAPMIAAQTTSQVLAGVSLQPVRSSARWPVSPCWPVLRCGCW